MVTRLTGGLTGLAKQRKVTTVVGTGTFTSPEHARRSPARTGPPPPVSFDSAIIAAGSEPVQLPFIPHDDPRVIDSTGALDLDDIPERLLVLGGGIIGLEMATVYSELGTKISVVELMDQLIPGADKDLVTPLTKRIAKDYEAIWLGTKVTAVEAGPDGLTVSFDAGQQGQGQGPRDRGVRQGAGRGRAPAQRPRRSAPRPPGCSSTSAGSSRSTSSNAPTSATSSPSATSSASRCSPTRPPTKARSPPRTRAGHNSYFDATVIPSVAYTDPEVAWVGVTENEAKAAGVKYGKGVFPWAASGRSLSLGRDEGLTKVLFDETTDRIIGAGIVGPNAGDLIAEAALAIEIGADAADIGLTIHPHPTLSETVAMAAEAFEGTITDLYMPKKKK